MSVFLTGIVIVSLLYLLHSWEQEQFALKIKTQSELNYQSFQIALDSEFQKNQTRAQILGKEPSVAAELAKIYVESLSG
ncbi:hypothetical protein N9C83_06630, partial [Opitutales bacterium]|nr:hypothetical protein [Opitutales bacterium]